MSIKNQIYSTLSFCFVSLAVGLSTTSCGPGQLLSPTTTSILTSTSIPSTALPPSSTPTATSTPIPTNTATPTPTDKPTPTPTIVGGFPGKYLLVESYEGGKRVGLYQADGERIRTIWEHPDGADFVEVQWSPRGDRFFLEGAKWGEWGVLFIISDDGREIASFSTYLKFPRADWSPDGDLLAFTAPDQIGNSAIFLVDSDGSNLLKISEDYSNSAAPKFSPDGKYLLHRASGWETHILDLDTMKDRFLANSWPGEYDWSPDGSQIVYSDVTRSYLSYIYIINVDGTEDIRLSDDPNMDERYPIFSPDGKWVLYSGYGYKGTGNRIPMFGDNYYLVPSDGSQPPLLIGSGYGACWTPDGRLVVLNGWLADHQQTGGQGSYYGIQPGEAELIQFNNVGDGLVHGKWQPQSTYEGEVALSILTLPTPHPPYDTPPLYDDFEGLEIDDIKWELDGRDEDFSIEQRNGRLILQSNWLNEPSGYALNLVSPDDRRLDGVRTFEAKLMLRSGGSGFGLIKIAIATNGFWTQCQLSNSYDRPHFNCGVYSEGYDFHSTRSLQAEFDKWYSIKIEVDPESASLQFYFEDDLIEVYLPQNADRIIDQTFTPLVGIWVKENTAITGEVDNVRITEYP